MSQLVALSKDAHGHRRWIRPHDFRFAAGEVLVPLVAAELRRAILSLPVAFVPEGDGFAIVAVLGMKPGENLFVDAHGQWLAGAYVPLALRCHPFSLADTAGGRVVCVDDSQLAGEGADGEEFFGADGQLSPALAPVVDYLSHIDAARPVTRAACAALQAAGIIQSWNITLTVSGIERKVQGLYTADETALAELPDDVFLPLRRSAALAVAYCQLVSQQHLQQLAQQVECRESLTQPRELDLEFLNRGDLFNFSGLG